ncbi:MAG TPA: DNA cytosine methyltransferase [Candidatus Eisenbacteria bacterium]|jgi:site-specific DNA-cytosine methylase
MVRLKIAELFAGIGGVAGGLLDAGGFDPVLLIDREPLAAKVFNANFPTYAPRYHTRSVSARLTGRELLEQAGGEIDGILGCPPCQGYSAAGLRDPDDARNQLLDEMRRLIASIEPLFFLIENVPSLRSSHQFERFGQSLESKYEIAAQVLNAAEFGIPQLRRRLVVLGVHRCAKVSPSFPTPTHGGKGRVFDYCSGRYLRPSSPAGRQAFQVDPGLHFARRKMVTLSAALDDLPANPPLHLGRGLSGDAPLEYAGPARTTFQRRMRRESRRPTHHVAWRHRSTLVKRLARIAPGDCPPGTGGRSRNAEYFSQAYARLHPAGLARTVTTNFHNPGSGRFTHYAVPRALTLREAMRLQSFPDSFVLPEMHLSEAERLIGNAFPRRLAEVLGRHIARLLSGR